MDIAVEDNRRRIKAWKHHMPAMKQQYSERDIIALTKRIPTLQLHLFKCNRLISKGSIANESFYTPFDIVFAVKENNMGKLSSHLWIMRGFARQLNPDFITLLDVGTKVSYGRFCECSQCRQPSSSSTTRWRKTRKLVGAAVRFSSFHLSLITRRR